MISERVFRLREGDGTSEYRIRPDGRLERRHLNPPGFADAKQALWQAVDPEDIVRHITFDTSVAKWLVSTLRSMAS